MKSIHTRCHQMCDSCGDHFGFTASGTGYDHYGAILVKYGFFLLGVQSIQIRMHSSNLRSMSLGIWIVKKYLTKLNNMQRIEADVEKQGF
jgi:hypothetical protein